MNILGINEGHNASAALLIDGVLVSAISEDRPSRQSTRSGFPFGAIEQCLEIAGLGHGDIDHVALATHGLPPKYFFVPRESFSFDDYWREQMEYWKPQFNGKDKPAYLDVFKDKIDRGRFVYDESLIKDEDDVEGMLEARLCHLESYMKISRRKISIHDHHSCHAYYGYLTHPNRDRDLVVLTADGGGDKCNGTVWLGRKGQKLEELNRTNQCNIGRMYRYATLILGMKQFEHAYKVMGLAPYSNEKIGRKAYEVYAETLQVDGLGFSYKITPDDNFFYFKDRLDGLRFDGIAWGIQKRTEELLSGWVGNAVAQSGASDVVMSGGVAMNIKANKVIWERDDVSSVFVPPGSGDESISAGAAFMAAIDNPQVAAEKMENMTPFKTAYLGVSFGDDDIKKRIEKFDLPENCATRQVNDDDVAEVLSQGNVVARFAGRGEFGPRALGNRSILADPRNPQVVRTINEMIKQRDFWMPFAASMLAERADDYIVNPKKLDGSYMTVAFDTTPLGQRDLPSGLHPYDQTSRPQVVTQKANPGYHALLSSFEKKTGIGALLNTSFNLHGEPIVATPEDALSTFARSGLNHVLIGSWLVSKRESKETGYDA